MSFYVNQVTIVYMRKLIDKIRVNRDQREKLIKIVRAKKSEQREVLRARIILLLWEGNDENEVAEKLSVTAKTVRKWRDRFHAKGIKGLKIALAQGRQRPLLPYKGVKL
ncbi:Homeodomain-like domain-containing protein [Anaerobacterium chartisolvens]|uniref:Homeodomain-like domain-containing protein n=2 Tax=Anaerobacterium chartisolvens TaxID=1297424 RepID=A0A369BD33_9FIRM|nr:Homeodomain-like domain-containing protein [Anaerobacterium chartisolvens]